MTLTDFASSLNNYFRTSPMQVSCCVSTLIVCEVCFLIAVCSCNLEKDDLKRQAQTTVLSRTDAVKRFLASITFWGTPEAPEPH